MVSECVEDKDKDGREAGREKLVEIKEANRWGTHPCL
jgi:hypothetical protein